MNLHTPYAKNHDHLRDLSSRYVHVEELPWKSTPYPGVEIKILSGAKDFSECVRKICFR